MACVLALTLPCRLITVATHSMISGIDIQQMLFSIKDTVSVAGQSVEFLYMCVCVGGGGIPFVSNIDLGQGTRLYRDPFRFQYRSRPGNPVIYVGMPPGYMEVGN